jgi:hypothetical protein
MEKIENSTKRLELINQLISNCDTKSSFILTFYGVVLTIIFTSNIGEEMINSFSFIRAKEIDWESFGKFILLLISIAFLISSTLTLYQIYSTLKGRIDTKVYSQNGLNTDSNIFFGSISSKTFEVFQNESNNEDESTYLNDLNSQVYINSKIVNEKFKNYNKSLFWMMISLAIFILYVIIK